MSLKLAKNKARCKLCGDVKESTHVHDLRTCSCGSLSVDGGLAYVRRLFVSADQYEELSEYTE